MTFTLELPPSSTQKSSLSLPSTMRGAFLGAKRRDACLASPVLLPPHQTTGALEKRINTALESKLLARNGRSTAFEVYGVDPNTLTRYFLGAASKKNDFIARMKGNDLQIQVLLYLIHVQKLK